MANSLEKRRAFKEIVQYKAQGKGKVHIPLIIERADGSILEHLDFPE